MLFDDPRNRQSELLAFQAETLQKQGDLAAAREHYARAAALETSILEDTPREQRQAFNILAVSAVALWKKAGRPDRVEELASRLLLRAADLSPYAFRELRTMRDEARTPGPGAHA
jgi:hypothetical protein